MDKKQNTGCYVVLTGLLKKTSGLNMDEQGVISMPIIITTFFKSKEIDHTVILKHEAALQMKQFLFLNDHLLIEGDLHQNHDGYYVIAEKITVLTNSGSSKFDASSTKIALKSEEIKEPMRYH